MRIGLYFGEALWGIRYWDAVPRKGDEILIKIGSGKQAETLEVAGVLWTGDDDSPFVKLSLISNHEG